MFAARPASASASWCASSSSSSAWATKGSEYEPSVSSRRDIGNVPYKSATGESRSYALQDCWRTERSKGALWASRESRQTKDITSANTCSHVGEAGTISGAIPWMPTFLAWNESIPAGGSMRQDAVSTPPPSRTLASPTAHAAARGIRGLEIDGGEFERRMRRGGHDQDCSHNGRHFWARRSPLAARTLKSVLVVPVRRPGVGGPGSWRAGASGAPRLR